MRTKTLERKLSELGYIKKDAILEYVDKGFGSTNQSTQEVKRSLSDELNGLKQQIANCQKDVSELPQESEYQEIKSQINEILEGIKRVIDYLNEVKADHKDCTELKAFQNETRKELSLIRKMIASRNRIVDDRLQQIEITTEKAKQDSTNAYKVSKKYRSDSAKYIQDAKHALNENLDKIDAFADTYNAMLASQAKKRGRINTQKPWANTSRLAESS